MTDLGLTSGEALLPITSVLKHPVQHGRCNLFETNMKQSENLMTLSLQRKAT